MSEVTELLGTCERCGKTLEVSAASLHLCGEAVNVSGWHVGHNIPGYMPESDVWHAETLGEALDGLRYDLEGVADYFAQLLGEGEELDAAINEALDEIDAEIARLGEEAHQIDVVRWGGWSVLVPNAIGISHDLGTHYWVARCREGDMCELLEDQREGWER